MSDVLTALRTDPFLLIPLISLGGSVLLGVCIVAVAPLLKEWTRDSPKTPPRTDQQG